jgi:ligand-binding sensor domain-containing protein
MRVTVQQGQNIYDIAKMYYGGVEGVQLLIADNPETITDIRDSIAPGTVLNIDSDPVNSVVVRQLQSRDERIPLNEKTVFANDDNYEFDVWENISTIPLGRPVNCVTIASNGDVWVGTNLSGVYRRKYGQTSWINYTTSGLGSLASNSIRSIIEASGGVIYAATGAGVARFNGFMWNANYTTSDGLPSNDCQWLGVYDGDFVVGTDTGVSFTADWSTYTNYDSTDAELNSDDVRHGFTDANGDLWLATDAGLSVWRLATSTVDLYDNAGGELPSDDVVHLFGYNGIIYVATAADGLVIYDGSNWITHDTSGPNAPNDEPTFLVANSLGVIYAGFENTSNGVLSIVRRRDSWSEEASSANSDMPDDTVKCMAIDYEDNLWIGTAASGLFYYNKNILING